MSGANSPPVKLGSQHENLQIAASKFPCVSEQKAQGCDIACLRQLTRTTPSVRGRKPDKMWGTAFCGVMSAASCRADGCAVWHSSGMLPLRLRDRSISRRQPVRAHRVEGSRGIRQRRNQFDRPNFRRLSLAGNNLRLAPLRWSTKRCLAASHGSASSFQLHLQPARRPRRNSLDWNYQGTR